ncbi:MAG: cation:proton antiporter, partial [Proteobacteria bacterium]|nr:cation:proton antiporter [Pseudomonadota bacterium]
ADVALAVGEAILVIGLIYIVGRRILRPCLHMVARTKSPEMFMAVILLVVIGTSAITAKAGLSMALGAFLAGLLLAESEYRHEIEVDIEPFKGLMLGLFFMSVGMGIDWRVVGDEPFWIAASVVGLFALKSLVTAGLCLAFGMPRHTSIETGLLLGQGGEFAFIVVGLAMSLQLLARDVGQFMLIVAGLTMLITPLVALAAEKLSAYLAGSAPDDADLHPIPDAEGLEGHVVLAGFGRVGRTLIDTLQAETIPFIALDTDPAVVARARAARLPVYYGDASRLDILARAHIEHAAAVVITMNDPVATERSVAEIHRTWPFVEIYARARDKAQAARLLGAGASVVVPETIEASLQLAGRVLEGFGLSDEVVHRRLQHQRTVEEA